MPLHTWEHNTQCHPFISYGTLLLHTHDWLGVYLDRNHKEARNSFLSVGSPKLQRAGGQALRSKQYLDLQSQQAALHPAAGSVGSESGELGPAALNS